MNSDLLHQMLRISCQLANEIGKKAQNPGMNDVKYLVGVGNPIRQRSLAHASPLRTFRKLSTFVRIYQVAVADKARNPINPAPKVGQNTSEVLLSAGFLAIEPEALSQPLRSNLK